MEAHHEEGVGVAQPPRPLHARSNLLSTVAMRMEARTKHLSPSLRAAQASPLPEDFAGDSAQQKDPERIFDDLIGCSQVCVGVGVCVCVCVCGCGCGCVYDEYTW